jgi:hypothetical protein
MPSKTTFHYACAAAMLLAAGAHPAYAEDTIATDRPDFVESSNVVGKGRVQIETSVAQDRESGARTFSTPVLLRLGVSDTLELRIETDGRLRASADGMATQRGYGDASLGVKWHLRDQDGALPSTAVLLHTDLTSGSAAFRAPGPRPSFRVAAEWELADGMSFGVMPGVATDREAGPRRTTAILAAVLGKEWTDRLRSFVELAAPRIARARNGGTVATFDIGAAYMLTDRCQVDAALSRGLNRNTADLSWTVGFSFKL